MIPVLDEISKYTENVWKLLKQLRIILYLLNLMTNAGLYFVCLFKI